MIVFYLVVALALLLMYRSAARYDAQHEHEYWTEHDERFARDGEFDRNRAAMGAR